MSKTNLPALTQMAIILSLVRLHCTEWISGWRRITNGYFLSIFFHGVELLAPHPTPKLEGHPLSAVRDCLFNLFAATLHVGGRSSIRNLRTRYAVLTGTHKHRNHTLIHILTQERDIHSVNTSIIKLVTNSVKLNEEKNCVLKKQDCFK